MSILKILGSRPSLTVMKEHVLKKPDLKDQRRAMVYKLLFGYLYARVLRISKKTLDFLRRRRSILKVNHNYVKNSVWG